MESGPGCALADIHVSSDYSVEELHEYIPFRVAHKDGEETKVLALDCEMSYTVKGLELTRCTVLDYAGKVILDTLVQPALDVIDFNTKYSGLNAATYRRGGFNYIFLPGTVMEPRPLSLRELQDYLFENLIFSETILVGHSLESDLKALRVSFMKWRN